MKQFLNLSQFSDSSGYIKLAVLVLVLLACLWLIFFTKKPSVSVGNGFLTIKSLFFGKTISVGEIDINGIKPLNLKIDKGYNLMIRTFGIGMPNYHVGWMRLRNGNKAFVFLKDKTNVVLIPTKDYDILISSSDFEGIKKALQRNVNYQSSENATDTQSGTLERQALNLSYASPNV